MYPVTYYGRKTSPMYYYDILDMLELMFSMAFSFCKTEEGKKESLCEPHTLEEIKMFQENTGCPRAEPGLVEKAVRYFSEQGYLLKQPDATYIGSEKF